MHDFRRNFDTRRLGPNGHRRHMHHMVPAPRRSLLCILGRHRCARLPSDKLTSSARSIRAAARSAGYECSLPGAHVQVYARAREPPMQVVVNPARSVWLAPSWYIGERTPSCFNEHTDDRHHRKYRVSLRYAARHCHVSIEWPTSSEHRIRRNRIVWVIWIYRRCDPSGRTDRHVPGNCFTSNSIITRCMASNARPLVSSPS